MQTTTIENQVPENQTIHELMTLKQVRDYCQIKRTTLWEWENSRGLRTIAVGGIKRVRRSDLDEFLRRHEQKKDVLGLAAAA